MHKDDQRYCLLNDCYLVGGRVIYRLGSDQVVWLSELMRAAYCAAATPSGPAI